MFKAYISKVLSSLCFIMLHVGVITNARKDADLRN